MSKNLIIVKQWFYNTHIEEIKKSFKTSLGL